MKTILFLLLMLIMGGLAEDSATVTISAWIEAINTTKNISSNITYNNTTVNICQIQSY
ncbi:MAG: hypothetical protein M0R80_04310 [Proteobacteria bacterium]|jgi:hypothetical protein|nr:hypothetical protein [Pseudomonadota bacterium]